MNDERELLRVEVENLHCEGCAEALREALGERAGLELEAVNVKQGYLRVRLDLERTDREGLREAVREAGFPATSLRRIDESEQSGMPGRVEGASFGWIAVGFLLLGVVGYAGYKLYPRFDPPAAEGATLLLLAAGAGIASFFSPCAFGLLVTLLAREAGDGSVRGLSRPFRFAMGMSVGAAAFVAIVGGLIAVGASSLVAGVTFASAAGRTLRLVVGVLLVLLGLVQLGLLPSPLHRVEQWIEPLQRLSARERRQRPLWGWILFGFGYLLAGFG